MTNHAVKPNNQILMVEDSVDDYEATLRAFQKVNFANPIAWAQSGDEALAYLKSDDHAQPSLILLDLNMPGIDGRQTLQLIKKDPKLSSIPVIILTTSSDERDITDCYELGASTYIQKPVDFNGLIVAVQGLKEYWFEIALLPKARND